MLVGAAGILVEVAWLLVTLAALTDSSYEGTRSVGQALEASRGVVAGYGGRPHRLGDDLGRCQGMWWV